MHPFLSGRASRAAVVDRLIGAMQDTDGLWIATLEEIDAHVATLGLEPLRHTVPPLDLEPVRHTVPPLDARPVRHTVPSLDARPAGAGQADTNAESATDAAGTSPPPVTPPQPPPGHPAILRRNPHGPAQ